MRLFLQKYIQFLCIIEGVLSEVFYVMYGLVKCQSLWIFSNLTAHTLNSGILEIGSSAAIVKALAGDSGK